METSYLVEEVHENKSFDASKTKSSISYCCLLKHDQLFLPY